MASSGQSTGPTPDVAVIGGGIVGLATAAHLAEAGASVVLYEVEAIGAGASGRNSGVVQRPFDEALVALNLETVRLYRDLEAHGIRGLALGAEPAGLMLVSRHRPAVERIVADLARRFPDLAPEVVEGQALRTMEPALADGLVAARFPIGYPIPPGAAVYAYASRAEVLGVRVRLGRGAALEVAGGRAIGVRVGGRVEVAGSVVVAAGPWTPGIVDPSGEWRPIRPVWGVVVEALLADPPRHVLEEAEMDEALGTAEVARGAEGDLGAGQESPGDAGGLEAGERGLVPDFSLVTAAGVSAVGSTFLDDEPNVRDWQVPILSRAAEFVPGVADAPIRGVRVCARPGSVDGRPLLGALPGVEGLYIAAGHGPWGISTGPASGRLVADLVVGRTVAIPPELDAGRFGSPFVR